MVILFNGTGAFNSVYHHRILQALAEIFPPVRRYAINLYGRGSPKLLNVMGDETTAVIGSARGAQQRCNNDLLGYSAGGVKIPEEL